jgi:hypothetical protein
MGETIEVVGYDELCVPGDLDDLALATEDTIAHVAPAATHHPSPPVDYGGILGPRPPVPKRLTGNANHPEAWWTTPLQSPALYAALLHDALCFGGLPDGGRHRSVHLLLARDRLIVPDSYFVRSTIRSLPEDLIEHIAASGPRHGAEIPTRPGLHYFAGAAWSHFGHFVLEGLSRLWLLERLPDSVQAELRFVFYNDRPLPPWQLECLAALGVAPERIVYLTEPQRFERMIVPSLAYNLHRWAAPAQGAAWERIGRAFDRGLVQQGAVGRVARAREIYARGAPRHRDRPLDRRRWRGAMRARAGAPRPRLRIPMPRRSPATTRHPSAAGRRG